MKIETDRVIGEQIWYTDRGIVERAELFKIAVIVTKKGAEVTYYAGELIGTENHAYIVNSDNFTFYDSKLEAAEAWLFAQGLETGIINGNN